MVVKDNKRKTCVLIEMLERTDNNISVREYNKINKYKDLEIEIEIMWHLTVPVVVQVLGMINRRIDKPIKNISGCFNQYEIQKKCIFGNGYVFTRKLIT